MIRIALCDDDKEFLVSLNVFIESVFVTKGCEVDIQIYEDGKNLIKTIKRNKVIFDIIFLDVDMPGYNGFKIAEKLRKFNGNFTLIFLTNLKAYATEGYKYEAFRYIIKADYKKEVEEAVEKFITKTNDIRLNEEQVAFKIKQETFYDTIYVHKQEVLFLEVDSKKRVKLITTNTTMNLLILPLKRYKDMLMGDNFEIIMRSYLVNFDHVARIDGENFIMSNGINIHLGYSKKVRDAALKKYMLYKNVRL